MDLFSELVDAVQSDLNIDDNSSQFPLATVELAINRAYIKSGGLFRWPELEDAKKTSTENGQEYYDYPDTWRPDSVWKLVVDSVRYGEDPDGSPIAYDDYLNWREDYPDSTDKRWANQWRRYFFHPTPTTDGSNNIVVWGQMNVTTLTNDADITIWSYSMPECNDAVVLEAGAILKAKGEDDRGSQFKSAEAKGILIMSWSKIKQDQAKYKKVQPFFKVDDLFSGKSNLREQVTGNFD